MIKKYRYGHPRETDAAVMKLTEETEENAFFETDCSKDGFTFFYRLGTEDIVFGLGEQIRGINKRGWIYVNRNRPAPSINEGRRSMYASHNFILVYGDRTFGAFFDNPKRVTFDIGYTRSDELRVACGDAYVYLVTGDDLNDIVRQFRALIGTSYIPPKWAFGYGQSRWGYKNEADVRRVADGYEKNNMPIDMIYLDIDYMDNYKDFTVDKNAFPHFAEFVSEMKERGIRLVPIIDAAVKAEEGYSVYDEGKEKGYFCTDENGDDFVVGVWPGDSVFPDVLNAEARHWFGAQYKVLLDSGVEGFWNDMNEPSIFYSRKEIDKLLETAWDMKDKTLDLKRFGELQSAFLTLSNKDSDYASFYHHCCSERVNHIEVHNLFGYFMTRAAAEYMQEYGGGKRYLLFSRSSYIGMHRYGGIWTGDNASYWSHLLLNLKMLPSLNMCGFLYVGADIGGFGDNTTEDLLLRWLALGIFTPLMRNHSTKDTRPQECYEFDKKDTIRNFLKIRYALIPYLYSEYVKSALRNKMMFQPLCFAYPSDKRARSIEDQLLVGESIMIAPVYEQNAVGRYVYLPESMKMIRMASDENYTEEILERGDHYLEIPLEEVVFFVRRGRAVPLAKAAPNVSSLNEDALRWITFGDGELQYEICRDNGEEPVFEKNIKRVFVQSGKI